MLLSHAAHGIATSSVSGIGEIALRDGLIVAAAAVAAQERQAWILEREDKPQGWNDSAVDLVIYRKGNSNTLRSVGAVELKWWRRSDKGNASNRRRDLVRDLWRAAALYPSMSDFSLVALLSTKKSWDATAKTRGNDLTAMRKLMRKGSQTWNLKKLKGVPCVRNAVGSLNGRVPIVNAFHTSVVSFSGLTSPGGVEVFARVWAVRKPQNTKVLGSSEVEEIL